MFTILVSGCLGALTVPSENDLLAAPSAPPVAATQAPYPPTNKPYLERNVIIEVKRIDANTVAVTNAGGADASSLMGLWLNVNIRGYVFPSSGRVTSQAGSTAYYPVPEGSHITITGEFPDCNANLWVGYTSTATPAPTQAPAYYPTPGPTQAPSQTGDYYSRSYKWSFSGYDYTWDLTISKDAYDFYKSRPHNRQSNYAMYAMSDMTGHTSAAWSISLTKHRRGTDFQSMNR